MSEIKASKDELLRITGPASLIIEEGKALILGAEYEKGDRIVVRRTRTLCMKVLEDLYMRGIIGEGGKLERPAPSDEVVDNWMELSELIVSAESKPTIILVVGPVESGKTSFSITLANTSYYKMMKTYVVDGDVGQTDIGCPGFVSASRVNSRILYLSDLKPEIMRFVGYISPMPNPTAVSSAIYDITNNVVTAGAEIVIINTDGWLNSLESIMAKIGLVKLVKPDYVITLLPEDYTWVYNSLKRKLQGYCGRIIRAKSPAIKRVRSRAERKILREQAYTRMLANANIVKLSLNEVSFINTRLFTGNPLSRSEIEEISRKCNIKVVYCEVAGNHAIIIVDDTDLINEGRKEKLKEVLKCNMVEVRRKGWEKGLLLAVLDENLNDASPGMLKEIRWDSGEIIVKTSYTGKITAIAVGCIKLREEKENIIEERKFRGVPL